MINVLWFIVLSAMLTMYAVLDGFDLGVGAAHMWIGRDDEERGRAIAAIGPVWNGNEVWLIASGGAMVVAFPHLYASAFSGFYLALMLVLWLLILRGVGIELRHQVDDPLWRRAWDVTFSGASALLAVLFGVALANVLRGVPFDAQGEFVGSFALLLNPFAILGGVLGLVLLSMHGAAYLGLKTDGPMHARAHQAVGALWWVVVGGVIAIVAASFAVRPDFTSNFLRWPWLLVAPLLAVGALVMVRVYHARRAERQTFMATGGLIAWLLVSVFGGLFPRLLPALDVTVHPGLDIYNAAAPASSMRIALGIYLFGMAIVVSYSIRIYRVWRGKVAVGAGYHA
jgi:cytochrome bd ubiquinol oxidase subunit II